MDILRVWADKPTAVKQTNEIAAGSIEIFIVTSVRNRPDLYFPFAFSRAYVNFSIAKRAGRTWYVDTIVGHGYEVTQTFSPLVVLIVVSLDALATNTSILVGCGVKISRCTIAARGCRVGPRTSQCRLIVVKITAVIGKR